MDYQFTSPWQKDATDYQREQEQREYSKTYKYESLWANPPLSAKKQEQLANYKVVFSSYFIHSASAHQTARITTHIMAFLTVYATVQDRI
jgi:hypothetical protein